MNSSTYADLWFTFSTLTVDSEQFIRFMKLYSRHFEGWFLAYCIEVAVYSTGPYCCFISVVFPATHSSAVI